MGKPYNIGVIMQKLKNIQIRRSVRARGDKSENQDARITERKKDEGK